ncbi:hypothetical protein M422DRAFT_131079, partial [Sphaerobolus stellatus SS14]
PGVRDMFEQLGAVILRKANFDPEQTQMMDFACGYGAMSLQLAMHCKRIVGVDISQGMVGAYNKELPAAGFANTRGVCAELRPDVEENQLEGEKFDVIICARSYKHIADNVGITQALKSYLKPRGILLVLDIITGKTRSTMPLVPALMAHKDGYNEDDMKNIFDAAGLQEFEYE